MACCLPTCAKGSSVPVMGNTGNGILVFFLASLLCLVCLGSASFAGLPYAHKTWVTLVCLLLDTSFWRCSVGALPLEPLEGMSGQLIKSLVIFGLGMFLLMEATKTSLSGTAQSPW